MRSILQISGIIVLFCKFSICLAGSSDNANLQYSNNPVITPVENRIKQEAKIPANYFDVTLYKPTYILPYYYTGSPDNAAYQNTTPNNEQLKHAEVKYQFSFKVPVWKNIFGHRSTLNLAYTQLSYWQLYDQRAFFRESNYEPEVFLANQIHFHLFKDWNVNFLNVGASHQSNGYGNSLERSWNRLYLEAIASGGNWMVSLKPWYIMSENGNNNNIAQYLGYAQAVVAYKYHKQVFAVTAHSLLEQGGKRATAELTWSFPLTSYLKGYVQLFSGYGQSLIEYNHRTNSAGVGIALGDWV